MYLSFRNARNIGLSSLLLMVVFVSFFSYTVINKFSMRIEDIIMEKEAELHSWQELNDIVTSCKDSFYDYRIGRIGVMSPTILLVNEAIEKLKEMEGIAEVIKSEEYEGKIREVTGAVKVFKQAVNVYKREIKEGYGGGSSASEMELLVTSSADTVANITRAAFHDTEEKTRETMIELVNVTSIAKNILTVVLIFSTILVFIIAIFMGNVLAKGLREVSAVAKKIAGGDLSQRLEVRSNDEIGVLAESFNKMTAELRKQREQLVGKEQMENILSSIVDALVVIDAKANIAMVNREMCEMLEYEERELVGKPVNTFFSEVMENANEGRPVGWIDELMERGTIREHSMLYITKAGARIPVSFSGAIMRDANGTMTGMVGVARDMREIKRMVEKEKNISAIVAAAKAEHLKAEELKRAYKRLEDTQYQLIQSAKLASIGRLVSDMAHEVNNPLMIISGRAQLSMVDANAIGDKSIADNLRIISDQCSRAKDIIKRLLLFSKPSKGEHKEADINETVEFVVALVEHQYSLNNVTFVRKYAHALPYVKIDEKQIHEVFMNIVRNAADAMQNGGMITVTTIKEEGNIRVDIQDTGEGISEKDLVKIFDPFFTTKKTGTGLGLSVCYGIVKEAHGGDIRYTSTVGKGTTASVILSLEPKKA